MPCARFYCIGGRHVLGGQSVDHCPGIGVAVCTLRALARQAAQFRLLRGSIGRVRLVSGRDAGVGPDRARAGLGRSGCHVSKLRASKRPPPPGGRAARLSGAGFDRGRGARSPALLEAEEVLVWRVLVSPWNADQAATLIGPVGDRCGLPGAVARASPLGAGERSSWGRFRRPSQRTRQPT